MKLELNLKYRNINLRKLYTFKLIKYSLNERIVLLRTRTFGGNPNRWNFLPISGNLSATSRLVLDFILSSAL